MRLEYYHKELPSSWRKDGKGAGIRLTVFSSDGYLPYFLRAHVSPEFGPFRALFHNL